MATMTQQPAAKAPGEPDIWRQPDGEPMACEESIAVLRDNLAEIHGICQDALEDAVLMDVSEVQFRDALIALIGELKNPYRKG